LQESVFARSERSILAALCRLLPNWVTSDGLTALGVVGAGLTGLGYWLAHWGLGYMWLSIAGLVINWFGDSLDGSLARFRKRERPQYGFFLDHTTDAFAMALIAVGIGLSPKTHLIFSLVVLAAYYLVVILSMATCLATGVFRISFGKVGPTEIRLAIIVCTLCAMTLPTPTWSVGAVTITVYDAVMIVASVAMIVTAIAQMAKTARELALLDPPRP
jgi:phosphatidylglycerophosphate synthase